MQVLQKVFSLCIITVILLVLLFQLVERYTKSAELKKPLPSSAHQRIADIFAVKDAPAAVTYAPAAVTDAPQIDDQIMKAASNVTSKEKPLPSSAHQRITDIFAVKDAPAAVTDAPQIDDQIMKAASNVTSNVFGGIISKQHRHTNLYPENLQLINIKNFKLTINADICDVRDIALVTIIHTACPHKAARDVIRQTWGTPNIPNVNTRLVFLLGQTDNQTLQEKISNESLEFGDLVQGEFLDTYHNLSYKNLFGKLWISQFCEQAEFVVKADDDMFVDLFAVYKVTRPYLKHEFYLNNSFIFCPVFFSHRIKRDPENKWYASYEDLPRDTEKHPGNSTEFYPDYCIGKIYIVNPGTAARLVEIGTHPKTLTFLWIDDVWVTGYLADDLNIELLDMKEFVTFETKRLLLMKYFQNPNIYHRAFISAPQDRNYEISLALHRYAEWCYIHNCWSNIYQPHRNVTFEDRINDELLVSKFINRNES